MSDRSSGTNVGWRKWRALPARDRRLFAALVLFLPLVATAIRFLGLGRVQRAMLPSSARPGSAQDANTDPIGLARLVDAAARRAPGRPACLPRSLTLWWVLRRRGLDGTLRIGVRTVAGRLEAHAWVEHDGRVLNDSADVAERFAPFEGIPLPSSWTEP